MASLKKFFDYLTYTGGVMTLLGLGSGIMTFTVFPGTKALMFDSISGRGVSTKVKGDGIHFKIPFLYEPILFNTKLNPHKIDIETNARDLQKVTITVRILEKPHEEKLRELYLSQTQDYAKRVLPNLTHQTIKNVVAKYNPDELITQRDKVSQQISKGLKEAVKDFFIEVHDVAIIHIEFSKEYREAIESKLVSQQMAERAKFIVQKSEEEKKITIIKSEAETDSAKIINNAIEEHGNAYIELKKLESAKEIVENLSTAKNLSFIPSSGGSNTNFLYQI